MTKITELGFLVGGIALLALLFARKKDTISPPLPLTPNIARFPASPEETAFRVASYAELVAQSATLADLNVARFGGLHSTGATPAGFDANYLEGRISYNEYLSLYNAYVAKIRSGTLLSNRGPFERTDLIRSLQ